MMLLNSFLLFQVHAQTLTEIEAHQHVMSAAVHETHYSMAKENKNEVQLVFSGLFLFYKNFISSQDGVSCVFSPSCSEYALLAIKKQGLIIGMANAFDRMTRCNGLSPEKYHTLPNSPIMLDEVK